MNRLWLGVPVIGFLALAGLLMAGIGKDPSIVPSALIDRPAPAFDLPDLMTPDSRFDSTDLSGKPYVLNVWASWCGACQIEHQTLTDLAESGVIDLYGLNWKDERSEALRWLEFFGNPYAAIGHDPDNQTGMDFGVYGAPETFLVDGNGQIRFKHVGPITDEIVANEILPLIAALEKS